MNSLLAVLVLASGVVISAADLRAARTNPVPVTMPVPAYPAALEDTGKSGQAVVEVTVTPDGRVVDPTVKSSDDPAFGEAVMAVITDWHFTPGMEDGVAVPARVALPFKFRAPIEQQFNAMLGRKVFVKLPSEARVLSVKEYGRRPKPLKPVPTNLPAGVKKNTYERVMVSFLIDPEGNVINPELAEPPKLAQLGAPALVKAALITFPPAVKDQKPVYVAMTMPIPFGVPPQAPRVSSGGGGGDGGGGGGGGGDGGY